MPASADHLERRPVGRLLPTLLLVLTVFGPISMDLYLPVLPALTDELGAATSVAQLTVTACLIGLALGQLVTGPASDRFGRSAPLYLGVVAYAATSLLCALSPTVETLIAARFVQGLAGGAGIVISQATGRDVYSGGALIRFYGRVTVAGGLAAVVGPLLGGQLAAVTDWRGLFVFLAAAGAVILALVALVFRETHPPAARTSGGAATRRDVAALLRTRAFTSAVLTQGFAYAALFAYLSGATFVLQGMYGLSPQQYALAFGLNSAGFMVSGYVAGLAAERWSVAGTLVLGLAVTALGALGLLAGGLFGAPLAMVVVSLVLLACGVAAVTPPSTTVALADHPRAAGTASSLLGMARFAFGAVSAPCVGVAGAATMLPLGVTTVVCVALAAAACARGRRDGYRTEADRNSLEVLATP